MKYALNLADDGRILSVTYEKYASADAVLVDELPEGNLNDFRWNGGFIYDPIQEQPKKVIAPRNLTIGEYITVNGVMYKITSNIPNGEPIVVGKNAIETTIEAQLLELKGE